MKNLVIILFVLPGLSLSAQETVKTYDLFGTEVRLVRYTSKKAGPLFYNMHDNENTSVEAAQKVVRARGGMLYELIHSGGRNIEFEVDSTWFAIDPNRIYTDTGVWRELERTGGRDSTVFLEVREFGEDLIQTMELAGQSLIVALHNNTDCRYCLYSYTEGGAYEDDAAAVYRGKWEDPDEFYFLTEADHFEALKPSGFHLILQDNTGVTDDGSLSVYCGFQGIEYINVEAQHGHVKKQRKMIKRMLRLLK